MPIDTPPPVVQQVIVSPRAGQRVTRPPLRIVVRAGREHGDLVARLNGVSIGDEFARSGRSLRRLDVSASHGLRHGRNTLRVRARIGSTVRRASVTFTIANRHPIPGAGRARRTVAGSAIRLRGRVVTHPGGPAARGVRWRVVSAPAGSRLRAARGAGRAARAARAAQARGLRRASTLTPLFTPDEPGRYVLRMTVGSGAAARAASVAVDAGPRSAVIPFDTAVDGADPAGTTSDRTPYGRPGIRVGGVVYRAPWLNGSGANGSWSGEAGGVDYTATWQVVVLDRRTLGFVFNRTYGRCSGRTSGGLRDYACRRGDGGEPVAVDMARELSQIDGDHLVFAVSHPSGDGARRRWDSPNEPYGRATPVTAIGFPADEPGAARQVLAGVPAGGAAVAGVGRLAPGRARWDVTRSGRARLHGMLVADVDDHYGYVADRRSSFDTRSESDCGQRHCTYALELDGARTSGIPAPGTAGFLAAVYDERTLKRRAAQVLGASAGEPTSDALYSLANFVEEQSAAGGGLFVITSFGPTLFRNGQVTRLSAARAADAIASIGGTRERFLTAAVTDGSGYTLIGWTGAGEGRGAEQVGAGARLRGALAPDQASRMRPANVSADGPPAERLQRLLVAPPTTVWPLDDRPGPRAAIAWIGLQSSRLGGDPRQAYWRQDATTLAAAADDVARLTAPSGQPFTAAEFALAQRQLLTELRWAGNVRDYLALLAAPAGETKATVWQEASILQDRLEAEIRIGKEEAEANAFWFGVVRALLSFAGGAGELVEAGERFGGLVEVMAAAVESAETGWEAGHDGGAEIDDDPRVKADMLAETLQRQAQQTVDSFWRIGNAIISDPAKLAEVGRWEGCLPNASSGGCPEGYEEYATTRADREKAARAARLALERVIYAQLVPANFPVWDTGLTRAPDPVANFDCFGGNYLNSPFHDAPRASWSAALEQVATPGAPDPNPAVGTMRWRVRIMVARSGTTYLHPSDEVLERMFGEVDADSDESGLGLLPQQVMRESDAIYEPGGAVGCVWDVPDSGGQTEPQQP